MQLTAEGAEFRRGPQRNANGGEREFDFIVPLSGSLGVAGLNALRAELW